MKTVTDAHLLQQEALKRRTKGKTVGFVPTMGFLHAGHRSLMDLARPRCDWLVVSIFVNPLQFGPGEDFARYPRDPDGDAELCRAAGVDCLFMPTELYAPDHATTVAVSGLTDGLCGASRPGHFTGVTTVVAKLFGLVQPSIAVFGEKDFQQLATIRRMCRDLSLPVEVMGGPIVREPDGLALSSRNSYLNPDQRLRAGSLSAALFAMKAAVEAGERDVLTLRALALSLLQIDQLDYLEVVDGRSLTPLLQVEPSARAFLAARIGATRLIDNVELLA